MNPENKIMLSNDETTDFPALPFRIAFETFDFDKYDKKISDIILKDNTQKVIHNALVISASPDIKNSQRNNTLSIDIIKRVENTNKFLVGLLNLRLKLSDNLFNEITDINRLLYDMPVVINEMASKTIPDKDINFIIKWCVKNGYPYSLDNKSLAYYSTGVSKKSNTEIEYTLKNTLIKPNIEYKFSLWEFLIDLHILCLVFILMNETINPDYNICGNLKTQYSSYITRYEKEERLDLITKIFSNVRLVAVPNFSDIKNEQPLEVYKKTNYEPMLFYAENAFDLALYIAYLSTRSEYKPIKLCPCCFEYFVPTRQNQKYCYIGRKNNRGGKCYPQLVYKRKQAQKNKS